MSDESILNIAFISDVHLENPRVPTSSIIKGLQIAFPNAVETADLDIIFIAGDLFDRSIMFSDTVVTEIQIWMAELLSLCKRWDIVLRILEGTPSHDRGQSANFDFINTISKIDADCRYIKNLSIEHMDKFDIDVLYVPDEWRHTTEETWDDVQQCLLETGIEKVDYAIMHGLFEFQIPPGLPIPHHDSEKYLGITRKYISVGHNHTMVKYARIIGQGAFGRDCHGEEEDKGHIRITSYGKEGTERDKMTFVVNDQAVIFKTVNLVGMDEEKITSTINELFKHPYDSYFRLVVEQHNPYMALINTLRNTHTEYHWKLRTEKSEQASGEFVVSFKNEFHAVEITPDNITDIIGKRLSASNNTALTEAANTLLRQYL